MKKLYIRLRLQKFFTSWFYRMAFDKIPFKIAYTSVQKSYENYPGEVLAEFDLNNRHYIIFK